MSYLLHPLEKVIDQLNSISPSVSKEKEIETCREEIRKQCLRFARQLIECSVTCTSSKKLSIQIRLYQSRIIEWINLLTSFSSDNSCHSNETHQRVVSYLTEILVFLQRHFQASFDTNQSLPVVCYQKHCTIISKRMAVIKERFQQSKLKPHLIDTIFHPFTDFINAKVAHYSFHDKYFLYDWLNHLDLISKENYTLDSLVQELSQNLIKFNLNSEKCIKYCIHFFTNNYIQNESKQEQIQSLKYYHKCINQSYLLPVKGYHPQKDSLKSILSNWLEQEIGYIENTCHINDQKPLPKAQSTSTFEKINTSASVSQLAYFFRLMINSGFFITKNKEEMIRFVCAHFSTPNQPNISIDSFKEKFYKPKAGSISGIRDYVIKLLNNIPKN